MATMVDSPRPLFQVVGVLGVVAGSVATWFAWLGAFLLLIGLVGQPYFVT